MRDDKDFLSYKTYVYNFFNSSNFFNFTQVEPAKLELVISTKVRKNIFGSLMTPISHLPHKTSIVPMFMCLLQCFVE